MDPYQEHVENVETPVDLANPQEGARSIRNIMSKFSFNNPLPVESGLSHAVEQKCPPTNTGWNEDHTNWVDIVIPGETRGWVYGKNIKLCVALEVRKEDGTAFADENEAGKSGTYPLPLLPFNWIKNIQLLVNQSRMRDNVDNDLFMLKNYLSLLLSKTEKTAKQDYEVLDFELPDPDAVAAADFHGTAVKEPNIKDDGEWNVKHRNDDATWSTMCPPFQVERVKKRMRGIHYFEVPIPTSLFNLNACYPVGSTLSLRIMKNDPSLAFMMADGGERCKIRLHDLQLKIFREYLRDDVNTSVLQHALKGSDLVYNMGVFHPTTHNVPNGANSMNILPLTTGEKPHTITCTMIDDNALNGDYKKCIFSFKNWRPKHVQFGYDGNQYPPYRGEDFDEESFGGVKLRENYNRIIRAQYGATPDNIDEQILFTMNRWKKGSFLIMVDLTLGQVGHASQNFKQQKTVGHVTFESSTYAALPAGMRFVCWRRFPTEVFLDPIDLQPSVATVGGV